MGGVDQVCAKSLSKSAAGLGVGPDSLYRCLALLATKHHSLPSYTSKGRAKAVLQLSEPISSSHRDAPAPHLVVNAYGVARACSSCVQTLSASAAIRPRLSDKLKHYVSCLSPTPTHSYSDTVHSANARVAAHEAGETRPSGWLLSGGRGEQPSRHPARTAMPRHLLTQRQSCSLPCAASWHQWNHQGKSKEDQSRGWIANRSNDPHSHLPPRQSVQEGERVSGKIKMHQL